MPTTRLTAAIAQVRTAAFAADPAETDGRLLARFIRDRDDAAFRELVRRTGPMVLGVCRRVAGDAHLAEDAFQAAFLVLARRAADVVPRETVRGWLHGVAVRTARKARAMSARRRRREAPVTALPDRPAPAHAGPEADLLLALDEEIAALPDHLRAATLVCELEGVSRRDAAARLGAPEGTLSSRLAKARCILARRLRQRGFALPAAGVGLALARAAHAVPPKLASAAAAVATGSVPPPAAVASLSHGVFKAMFLAKLKLVALGVLALAAAGWATVPPGRPAVAAGQPPAAAGQPPAAAGPATGKPATRPAGPGTLLLARQGGLVALTPEGKEGAGLTPPKDTHSVFRGRLSPDGTRVAFIVCDDGPPRADPPESWPMKVVVHRFGAADPAAVVDLPAQDLSLAWTADGARVVVTRETGRRPTTAAEHLLLDPATGKTEPLALPGAARVLDCGRDGKTFLVAHREGKKSVLGLAAAGDEEVRVLAELKGWTGSHMGRLSPDGKTVLYTDADPAQKDANKWGMSARPYLLDVATKRRTGLADFPDNGQCFGLAWSPDGKRVAYTWKQLHADLLRKDMLTGEDAQIETEAFLIIADADGRNAKTVASAKLENAINPIYGAVDWR